MESINMEAFDILEVNLWSNLKLSLNIHSTPAFESTANTWLNPRQWLVVINDR
jgi:hypothetical protein